ncbi:MAG: hypothetical protein ACKPCI_17380, partial [Dolichospermum sp.]
MNNKKHNNIIPTSNLTYSIYWSLLLTLPCLLLATAISVNSASAADNMVADNQNSELNTDKTAKATSVSVNDTKQVVAAAELEQNVVSVPEQKQPQLIAQTADGNPDDVNKIRQDLLIEPLIKIKVAPAPKPTYPPGLSFAAPSAFGANMGDVFLGTSAAFFGTRDTGLDGSISAGFGLGNSQKLVGLEF